MNVVEIQSLDIVSEYSRLTEAQLASREGLFIAESANVIRAALDYGLTPRSLLTERTHLAIIEKELGESIDGVPVYTAAPEVIERLTGYRLHRGILAAFSRPSPLPAEAVMTGASRIAVLENVTDPTNIGSIFRSAAALGMDAVLLSRSSCDPLHRRAARVSMGAVFKIPWAFLPRPVKNPAAADISVLKERGFTTLALALNDDSVPVDSPAFKQYEKLALILGAEGSGLTDQTVSACDKTVKIPMAHGMDSLNVAAAAAVAFWEMRQNNRR